MLLKQKPKKKLGESHWLTAVLIIIFSKVPGLSEWEYYPVGIENTMETGNF